MSVPTTRAQFKMFCLKRLGFPAISINLSSDIIDDRIDEAINLYTTYHYDGTEKSYYSYQIQAQDIVNKYITLPDNVIGAVGILDLGTQYGTGDIFNIQYQIAQNDIYNLTNLQVVPFFMAFQNLQFLQEILVGSQPVRYNRNDNNFYLDTDWTRFNAGDFLIVECYNVLDPTVAIKMWNDFWLQRYASALIKQSWGEVLSKYDGVPILAGVKLNASKILADAQREIEKLEQQLYNDLSPLYTILSA